MTIRKVKNSDIPKVRLLFEQLDNKHLANRPELKSPIPKERYERVFRRVFNDPNYIMLVAILDDFLIGFAIGRVFDVKNHEVLIDQRIGEILYLIIDPPFRRTGVARKMMAAIESEIKYLGSDKIELKVFSFNSEAMPELAGFKPKYTIYEK